MIDLHTHWAGQDVPSGFIAQPTLTPTYLSLLAISTDL